MGSEYRSVFGREPEPWREPLGALILTLNDPSEPDWMLARAREELRWLTRVLNEATEYRVLITGSREWTDQALMREMLLEARERANGRPMVLICGGARGADEMAQNLGVISDNCRVELYMADWNTHTLNCPEWDIGQKTCKLAGARRNQEMVDTTADLCLAFKVKGAGNRGTSDCVERAKKAGIEVMEIWDSE